MNRNIKMSIAVIIIFGIGISLDYFLNSSYSNFFYGVGFFVIMDWIYLILKK